MVWLRTRRPTGGAQRGASCTALAMIASTWEGVERQDRGSRLAGHRSPLLSRPPGEDHHAWRAIHTALPWRFQVPSATSDKPISTRVPGSGTAEEPPPANPDCVATLV